MLNKLFAFGFNLARRAIVAFVLEVQYEEFDYVFTIIIWLCVF